jgi:LPS export ABC transporter protein LptC
VTKLWPQVLVVLTLALIAGLFFFRRDPEPQLADWFDAPSLTAEGLPQLLQRIRDFHRVVTRKGEKILEISAKEASYFRDRSAIEIREPRLVFFHGGKEVGSISADRGWVVIEDAEFVSADLEGQARLALTKFAISADAMRYDRRERKIHAKGLTEVSTPEMELRGRDMLFDLNAHRLTVGSGVSMKISRPSQASGR